MGVPNKPCSDTNHLVLASWEGPDKYTALKERVGYIHGILKRALNSPIFLGGDLAFLCCNFGAHTSMGQPCIWCPHAFDKSHGVVKDIIPFEPIILKKSKKAVPRQEPIWPIELDYVSFYKI